jgi:hypothetical protein
MRNIKTKVIPVKIGATGTISKSLRKYVKSMTGKARNQGNAENSHTQHCTHTGESTDVKYRGFNVENSITCAENWNYRIAATLYHSNMVCFRYIIGDILHKGDNK